MEFIDTKSQIAILINCDSLRLLTRRRLGERYSQNAVLHRGFDGVGLQNAISAVPFRISNCRVFTCVPSGSCRVLENLPNRRSLILYPPSSRSVDSATSPETARQPLWTSMLTLSLERPGSSKVAVTRLLSASSCRFILQRESIPKPESRSVTAYLGLSK